jgi:hypothetical protein
LAGSRQAFVDVLVANGAGEASRTVTDTSTRGDVVAAGGAIFAGISCTVIREDAALMTRPSWSASAVKSGRLTWCNVAGNAAGRTGAFITADGITSARKGWAPLETIRLVTESSGPGCIASAVKGSDQVVAFAVQARIGSEDAFVQVNFAAGTSEADTDAAA